MSVQEKLQKPVEKLASSNRWVRGVVALLFAAGAFFGLEAANLDPETTSRLVTGALAFLAVYVGPLLLKIDLPGTWDDGLRESLIALIEREVRARAETDGTEGVKVPPPSDV